MAQRDRNRLDRADAHDLGRYTLAGIADKTRQRRQVKALERRLAHHQQGACAIAGLRAITRRDRAARRQLATQPDSLRTTPLMRVSGRSLGVDCGEVWLKLEHLQVAGSFKARGMLYRLLANPVPESGVIIASGGNAGIAVAACSSTSSALGVPCEPA